MCHDEGMMLNCAVIFKMLQVCVCDVYGAVMLKMLFCSVLLRYQPAELASLMVGVNTVASVLGRLEQTFLLT